MSATALIRRPSPHLDEGIVSHIEREPVDVARAVEQWEGYVAALQTSGWHTVEVPPADDCPDQRFCRRHDGRVRRDGGHFATGYADPRSPKPSPQSRRCLRSATTCIASPHPALSTAATSSRLGTSCMSRAEDARTARASDSCGRCSRRLACVSSRAADEGLHLKSAVTALPDGTIIGWPPALDDPGFFPHFMPMPEESGAHVVLLGGDSVLMADNAPRSADLLSDLGYTPVRVDISEFEKLEGCVTCLSVRLRDIPSR